MGDKQGVERERAPIVGFGPHDLVVVRVGRVDEKGKSVEEVRDELRNKVRGATSFGSAMYRQGRHVVYLGTNFGRGWINAVLECAVVPGGRLVHACRPGIGGGRTLTGYVLNWPTGLSYEEMADELMQYNELESTAGEKKQKLSDLVAQYNAGNKKAA